jgi:hypothetical protein
MFPRNSYCPPAGHQAEQDFLDVSQISPTNQWNHHTYITWDAEIAVIVPARTVSTV